MDSPGVFWGPVNSPERARIQATQALVTPSRTVYKSDTISPPFLESPSISSPSLNSPPPPDAILVTHQESPDLTGRGECKDTGLNNSDINLVVLDRSPPTELLPATPKTRGHSEVEDHHDSQPNPETTAPGGFRLEQNPDGGVYNVEDVADSESSLDLMSFESLSTPTRTPTRSANPITPSNIIVDLLAPTPTPEGNSPQPLPITLHTPTPLRVQDTSLIRPLLLVQQDNSATTPIRRPVIRFVTPQAKCSQFTTSGIETRMKQKPKDPTSGPIASSTTPLECPSTSSHALARTPKRDKKPAPLQQLRSLSPATTSLLSSILPRNHAPLPPTATHSAMDSRTEVTSSDQVPAGLHEDLNMGPLNQHAPRAILPHALAGPIFSISQPSPLFSASKSTLRHPSSFAMGSGPSRIPRPGAKRPQPSYPHLPDNPPNHSRVDSIASPLKPTRIPSPVKILTNRLVADKPLPFPSTNIFNTKLGRITEQATREEHPKDATTAGDSSVITLETEVHPRRTIRPRKLSSDNLPDPNSTPPALSRKRKATTDINRGAVKRAAYSGLPTDPATLRNLTVSNTNKNMKYVSKLDIKVVQKHGNRPESPSSKVRTVIQKSKEELMKKRNERAKRRAGVKDGAGSLEDDGNSSKADDEESIEESITLSRKHPRGPGDEEDYETPTRPKKRPRFGDSEDDSEQKEPSHRKNVKWNKELQQMAGATQAVRQTVTSLTKKSCLAPMSKALQLDMLGNVPNAGSPLSDIESEHIIVTKFVYDDDDPPKPVRKAAPRKKKPLVSS